MNTAQLIGVALALPVLLIGIVFLRALTARMMTGKWPHQDVGAKQIFDSLP